MKNAFIIGMMTYTGCILDLIACEPGAGCINKNATKLRYDEQSALGFSGQEIIDAWNEQDLRFTLTWSEGEGVEQGLTTQSFSTSLAALDGYRPYTYELDNDPGTYDPLCEGEIMSLPVEIRFTGEGEQLSIASMPASIWVRDDSLTDNLYINGSAEVVPDESLIQDDAEAIYTLFFRYFELDRVSHDRAIIRKGKHREWAIGTWALEP